MGAGHRPPWLHFAARVYSRDDMAHGATFGAAHKAPPPPASRRPASTPLVVPLRRNRAGVCFAEQQLCQCATDSRSDWLELIEGAGLNLIAKRARTQKLTRLSILQDCLIGVISGDVFPAISLMLIEGETPEQQRLFFGILI